MSIKAVAKVVVCFAAVLFGLSARADWVWSNGYLKNDTTGWTLRVASGTYAGVTGYSVTLTQAVGTGTVVDLRNEALPDGVEIVAITKITGVTELYLPDTVVYIADNAFYNNSTILKIEPFLPKNIKYIGVNAFYRATKLAGNLAIASESDTFNWGSADSYFFQRCYCVSNLVFGAAVTNVPCHAFDGCSALTNIVFEGPIASIGDGAFNGCGQLMTVSPFLPDTLSYIGSSVFYQNNKLQGPLTLGGSANLTYGSSRTFFRCYAISNVTFGVGMLQMPTSDWLAYEYLTNIVFKSFPAGIGSSLNNIKEYAVSITVPSGNDDWNTFFSTNNLILWDDLTATQQGYFTSSFPNAEVPYGMCKIGASKRYEWFYFATVETEGVKSLTIESNPSGIGSSSASPTFGTHEDVSDSLPLTCSVDAVAVSGDYRYTLAGYTLSQWDGEDWSADSTGSDSSLTFNPASDGAYKLTWQWNLTDYALTVAMPTLDFGTVTTNGTPTAEGFFAAGSTVTLTATAKSADAPFVRWFGDVADCDVSNATITVTMDSAKTVIPYFAHDWIYSSSASTVDDGYWVLKAKNIGAGATPELMLQNGDGVSVLSTVGTRELDLTKPIVDGGSFVKIGYKAFRYVSTVDELYLPDTIVAIAFNAFENNSTVQRIVPLLPNSVTNIETLAFYRSTSLQGRLTLGGGGKTLAFALSDGYLFDRNYGLTEVDIGRGITELPVYMFTSCTSISNVYFHAKPDYASTTFVFNSYQTRLFVPRSNADWKAFVKSSECVTPWADLTAAQQAKYTEKFGDAVLPKGLTVAAPANQWILYWSPADLRDGTVLMLR